jgi:lipopolysaccharide biosynthesis protein
VALHIHAHYIEDLPFIIKRIKKSKIRPDLYISTTSKEAEIKIISMLRFSRIKYKEIRIYPNRGRNIAPFISGFLPSLHKNYEIIGHIHLKKSLHSGRHAVQVWNNFLLENMIGGKHPMLDLIIQHMIQDKSIGIIYPDDPNIYGWGDNYSFACNLGERMRIPICKEEHKFNFPAGSMFWIRPAAIKPLMELNLQWDDYPEEPVHVDGTMLHALERLFGIIPEGTGFRTVLTNVPGISRILGSY